MKIAAGVLLLVVSPGCGDVPRKAGGPRLVVVEEHHEAWPAWEQARADGELAPGATLVHLDAHEDLGEPEFCEALPGKVTPDLARRLARGGMGVDELVLPGLFRGTVGEFRWVTPPWLTDEAPRVMDRWVASENGDRRRLAVASELPELLYPDRRPFRTRVVALDRPGRIEGAWILDIDLDFFACANPHATHLDEEITEEEYDRILAAGEVRRRGEARDGSRVTESVILARRPGPFAWPVRLDRIRDLRDGSRRFVRGAMCMGEYRDAFPVHSPAEEEIDALVGRVEAALGGVGHPPAVITVARSARSGFVPPMRVDSIQKRVIAALRRIYTIRE